MAFVIPASAYQAMRDGHRAWDQLVSFASNNTAKWSEEQKQQLGMMAELLKQHHAVLNRIIEANANG
jgi:hypothetical protein